MNTKSKGILKTVVLVCVLVALVAAALLMYLHFRDKPVEGEKNIEVTVVFSDTDKKTVKINTNALYLKDAIDENGEIRLEGSTSEWGFFVESVDGIIPNSDNQEWWCITKAGASTDSIDKTVIEDGDKFEITLTVGW